MSTIIEPAPQAANSPAVSRSHLNFPVVGIGASAGGLQALRRFFEQMPHDNGMAFVVVLHLSARHESNLDKILQRTTQMPVLQVTQPVPIEKNHIYVISPAMNLSMFDGYLRVTRAPPARGRQVAIDLFFRTLADVHRERAFCIILTGTGTDGSVGLARIKEQGGLTMAQSLEDAEYDEMPSSAISTGQVDMVLPVAEMPQKLLEIWANARSIRLPQDAAIELQLNPPVDEAEAKAAEQALSDVIGLLRARTNHDFKHYKRATVLRRIERRMQVNRQTDLPSYLQFLQSTPEETEQLLSDMLIGVTNFFRDREAFEALEREVMPLLFAGGGPDEREIRVWSAGCSTGEEPYSLTMLLCEQAALTNQACKIQVFATDIDEQAIAFGRTGVYPHAILTDVQPNRLRQFFTKEHMHFRVKRELREKVLFALHNLLRDPPFSKLNLIVCRNLLIYLDRDVQREILRIFHFALVPGGFLFLGGSESIDLSGDLFSPVDKRNRLFRAKTAASVSRSPPKLTSKGLQSRMPMDLERFAVPEHASFAEIHQRVLGHYASPSVIVNHASDIVHLSERVGQFLHYVGGEPSHNLLALVQPELRLELRTALFQAVRSGKSVEARRIKLQRDDHGVYITMVVRPFREGQHELILVLFEEVETSLGNETKEASDSGKSDLVAHLEQELQHLKEQLQSTIEQAETSTEELKASNEELQAINEELRSMTEELETSKEEQLSINEELITVNHELKVKVEEAGKVNDDLQNLISSTDIATVFVDRALGIRWFTPRAADIINIRSADTGRSLLDLTHRLKYDDLAKDVDRIFETGTLIEREVLSKDGRWYIARLVPYTSGKDEIEGAGLTFIDITRRHEAEAELRANQQRMHMLAQSTQDYAIIVMSDEGLITNWNRGAELIFGFTEAEALGQSAELFFVPEDRQLGIPMDELRRARESGRAEDERWHLRKDGTRIYCSGVVTPLHDIASDPAGLPRGFAKIARDLTERKRQEQAQEIQLEQTQAANQQKDKFLAVMSHELKHPLNLIQLNAELLSRLPAVRNLPVANRATHSIVASVRSQARVIEDLLDLSRLRTGKFHLNRTPVDLNQLLHGFTEVLEAEAKASELQVELKFARDELLVVDGDATRVEQIIWNLWSNALKFTPAGGRITLSLSADHACNMVRLDVADNGAGIDPASLPVIFDLFGQGSTLAQRHQNGLGIGLALVRQLAEAHGGSVQVQSPGLGQGATFSVWLPLYDQPFIDSPNAAPEGLGKLRNMRVLLVDDSVDVLDILRMLLEMEEAQVTSVTQGSEALRIASEQEFDLIISDIGMPEMDGYELIGKLRALPALAKVPAIALSGYGTPQDNRKALDAGFTLHLSKPVTLDALIEVISNLEL